MVEDSRFANLLKTLDIFGKPVPQFGFKGEKTVRTKAGGCLSFIVITITFLFAVLKLQHMLLKRNPTVTQLTETGGTNDEIFDLKEEGFMMAFALEDYASRSPRGDLRFLKWVAHYITYDINGDIAEEKAWPLSPCTVDDIAKFDLPDPSTSSNVDRLISQGGLFCLDYDALDIKIFGAYNGAYHSVLDVMLVPCNVKNTVLGGEEDNIPTDCNWDRQAAIDYIGDLNIVAYYNQGRFNPIGFGEESIQTSSTIHKDRTDTYHSTWIPVHIEKNILEDEVQIVQMGQASEHEFIDLSFKTVLPSTYNKWPTNENPENIYKFSSYALYLSQDLFMIER